MEEKTKIFWNNFMVKADRVFAWILLFVIILYAITGYGMTKGLIDSNIAHSLHLQILGIVGLTAFVIHTSWGIHLALKRWNLWNVFMKIVLVLFYTGLISGLLYVHFFYKGVEKERPNFPVNEQSSNISGNSSAINANDNNNTKTTVFTAETLSKYNGRNGSLSYIAVDGLVYDVSSLFRNGEHEGCLAGKDLTQEFYAEHSSSKLKDFTVVGTYNSN